MLHPAEDGMKFGTWVLVGLLAAPAIAQVTIEPRHIHTVKGKREVDVRYPHTGNAAVDKVLGGYAKGTAGYVDFSKPNDDLNPRSASMNFRVLRNDSQMLTVALDSNLDYGGAHPMPNGKFFTFLMPDGVEVFLPELVYGARGLKRISDLAKAQIRSETAKTVMLTENLQYDIDSGAGPYSLEHKSFIWKPDELVLSFGSYELFGYPEGPDVHIPMAQLADVVRPNPRAPQPSFDCDKARSAIEKTLCGSVELARQDRSLESQYAYALDRQHYYIVHFSKNAQKEQAALDKLVVEQRAWQAERDRQCANGEASCLAASYKKRLAEAYRF